MRPPVYNPPSKSLFLITVSLLFIPSLLSQSLRGLSFASDSSIWVSGSNGTVAVFKSSEFMKRSAVLNAVSPKAFPQKDFRDIHAFNEYTAIAMSIADSGVLLKTYDKGQSWKPVFQDNSPGVFFDVLEFNEAQTCGILMGDPLPSIPDYLYFKMTLDSGNHWISAANGKWNATHSKLNSLFAASGSSLKIRTFVKNDDLQIIKLSIVIGGGGPLGASLRWATVTWNYNGDIQEECIYDLPLNLPEAEAWGVYGLSEIHENQMIAAGGHWKFSEGRVLDTSYSGAWIIRWNTTFDESNFDNQTSLQVTDLNIPSYLSGVSLDPMGNFIAVGNLGWYQGTINPFGDKPTFFPKPTEFKSLHAVGFRNNHAYMIGNSDSLKWIKIPWTW
jgi:hypothetical protein